MSGTLESLRRKIDGAGDLEGVVRSIKALAASSIGQYEKAVQSLDDYYRTEEAVRHNKDSTGLGLAIVRHVSLSHGIRVRVESAPGRGTRFTLRFPPTG